MNQQNAPRKKKVFVTNSFKYLVAAVSVASTVGLWGVFSKQDAQAMNNTSTQIDPAPLPTLIPLNDVSTTGASVSGAAQTDPLALLPVATQPPSQSAVTSSNTGSVQIIQPNPVTQTRSSRR